MIKPIKGKYFLGYWTRRRDKKVFEAFANEGAFFHYWSYIREIGGKKVWACYDPGMDIVRQSKKTIEESKLELETRANCF